jgi:hypothetical protein
MPTAPPAWRASMRAPLPRPPPPPPSRDHDRGSGSGSSNSSCSGCRGGGAPPAALLADLPASAAADLGPYAPAFLALSDMAYPRDHVAGTPRRDPGPCLAAWGAAAPPTEIWAPGDPERRALVFRTRRDVIVAFRWALGGTRQPGQAASAASAMRQRGIMMSR